MPKNFSIYWYQKETSVADACLFNLRDKDLRNGGQVSSGTILTGLCGFSVAENVVNGFSGLEVDYQPNRCVEWEGYFLTCMALPGLPTGSIQSKGLRHKHYVVAELRSASEIKHAKSIGLPTTVDAKGHQLVNLEIFTVPSRTPVSRRATLL